MRVRSAQSNTLFQAKRRDPEIVFRDWPAFLLQLQPEHAIPVRGFLRDVQNIAGFNKFVICFEVVCYPEEISCSIEEFRDNRNGQADG